MSVKQRETMHQVKLLDAPFIPSGHTQEQSSALCVILQEPQTKESLQSTT